MLSLTAFAHKSYISITDMAYNIELKRIEVSIKLTAHDFEYVLEKRFKNSVEIDKVKDGSKEDLYIQEYISKNFIVKSNNVLAKFNYVGKEVNLRDELYFYFTFTSIDDFKKLIVTNTMLFETYQQQQNIVHYTVNNKTKSATLANKIKSGRFTY
jgi:hypothetical protein